MEHLTNIKTAILAIIGIIGGILVQLLGGWTTDLATLVIFLVTDYLMGLIVAGVFKNSKKSESGALKSFSAWKGLCKKLATVALVVLATRFDLLLGTSFIRTSTIIGFISSEAISIVENIGLMGVKLPPAFARALDILKNKSEEESK